MARRNGPICSCFWSIFCPFLPVFRVFSFLELGFVIFPFSGFELCSLRLIFLRLIFCVWFSAFGFSCVVLFRVVLFLRLIFFGVVACYDSEGAPRCGFCNEEFGRSKVFHSDLDTPFTAHSGLLVSGFCFLPKSQFSIADMMRTAQYDD